MQRLGTLALCFALAAPGVAAKDRSVGTTATDAGIRVWKPITILSPGRYVVVRNISARGAVFDIRSSDVEIDLNGFAVENTTDAGSTIQAFPLVLQNVTISNGTVRGGTTCIFTDRITHLTLEDLNVSGCDNGIFLDDNKAVTVERNRVEAVSRGINAEDCENCRFADNSVLGGIDFGIRVDLGDGAEIVGNRITESNSCMDVGGEGVTVRKNTVEECTNGISLRTENGLVEDNVMSKCAAALSFAAESEGNVYRSNLARGNGIDLADEGQGNTSHGDNYLPGRK